MSKIIAGGFETITAANAALQRLVEAGVPSEYICTYRVNPPGMHDRTAIGGDRDASPGAKKADKGAVKGAAVGAMVGLAAGAAMTPFLGPAGIAAGIGVGAYTGSLVGGLKETSHEPQPGHADLRPAETLVAVNADKAGVDEQTLVRIFEEAGAWQVERAEGRWENGVWADFDPVSYPRLIGGRDTRDQRPAGESSART
jgi:hypothetical protein